MNRAVFFILCLSLASLPASGGDKIGGAISDAVARKVEKREAAKADASDVELPVTANVGNKSSSRWHSVLWDDQDYSLNVASCPMDVAGAPTFEEVRSYFRNHTDNEMWKICVNRSSYPGPIAGACACSLLAYPGPWRPVEVEPPKGGDEEESDEMADVVVGPAEPSPDAPRIAEHP
jgi:hypothetical protein